MAKVKKWARQARRIVVHLEGADGADLRGEHPVEIRDAKNRLIRTKTLKLRDSSAALSSIMTNVQTKLLLNGLLVDAASYRFTAAGRLLLADVSVSKTHRRRAD